MKRSISLGLLLLLLLAASTAVLADDKAATKQARLDGIAKETIERLFEEKAGAKKLYEDAYGYAVFSSVKVALGVSGGGGSGVAVHRGDGSRTYMKMGTAGVGLGLGGRKYRIVFLFETKEVFDKFVEKGWQADASANATAGTDGADVSSSFSNGLAIYQFSEKGLMAQAEIAGTKYWKSDKLN